MRIVKDALPTDIAQRLRELFVGGEYVPVLQKEDSKYHLGEQYSCSYNRSRGVEKTTEFLEASKYLVSYVSDLGAIAVIHAYKMVAGDHFRVHDDNTNGIGFVYYLSEWKWDWGGILHVEKDGKMFPLLHKFNQLVVIDKGRPHFVSVVAPYAKPRYAVVGFIR